MKLEELHEQWRQLDQKLDRTLALGSELMREIVFQPARRRVHRLAFWPVFDLLFCVSVILFGVAFLGSRPRDENQVVPAVVLIVGTLGYLASCVWQLHLISLLDWSGPVAAIQAVLEQLRVMRIRQFKWIILLSPLLGFCALMIGLHWLFEWLTVDRVKILSQLNAWIAANYLFGVMFIPVGYFLAGVLARRCSHYSWWQTILDDISGKNLKSATLDVQRWASLHQDVKHVNT